MLFCKQKTAYELGISDWSSDVCSSDRGRPAGPRAERRQEPAREHAGSWTAPRSHPDSHRRLRDLTGSAAPLAVRRFAGFTAGRDFHPTPRGLCSIVGTSVQLERVLVLWLWSRVWSGSTGGAERSEEHTSEL